MGCYNIQISVLQTIPHWYPAINYSFIRYIPIYPYHSSLFPQHRVNLMIAQCKWGNPEWCRWITHDFNLKKNLMPTANKAQQHYSDIIMSAMASRSPASRLFTQPLIQAQIKKHFPYKGPITRQMFPFDDVIMKSFANVTVHDVIMKLYAFFTVHKVRLHVRPHRAYL